MDGQKPPQTPLQAVNSPGPENGSTPAEPSPEKRLLPRLVLSGEQFRLSANGKVFGVADLSQTGMALRLLQQEDRLLFPVGMRFSGVLNLNRMKHSVSGVVKNLRGDHVGCQFESLSDELSQELRQWLDPVSLGDSLRPMPSSSTLDSIWYNGRSGTELIVWPEARVHTGAHFDELKRVWIVLWGQEFVDWDRAAGVRTGTLKLGSERDSVQGVLRWAPEWLHEDPRPDLTKLNLAKTLVLSSKLPDGWKRKIVEGLVLPV